MKRLGFAVLVLLMSCGGGGGGSHGLSGHYEGGLTDSLQGPGTIILDLIDSSGALSGTFSDSFGVTGVLVGSRSGNSVQITAEPSQATACPLLATGQIVADGVISGTYAAFNCSQNDGGTFSVLRQ